MLIRINDVNPQPRMVQQVVEILKNDGVIIYPTDTVYGLGCSIFSKKGMKRLAQIKKNDSKKLKRLHLFKKKNYGKQDSQTISPRI